MADSVATRVDSREEVAAVAQRLTAARREIAAREPQTIAAVLARVAEAWLVPGSAWMRRAVTALAEIGPFSRPMLERGLPRMIAPLAGGALATLVRRELGDWKTLAEAAAPRVVLHVLPSNLPGHAAIPSALSLVMRAAALIKPGRDEGAFAPLWAESIRAVDPALGGCVADLYWPRGASGAMEAAIEASDLVVASGGDEAMSALARHCATAGVRFIGHGHRVSLALVCRGHLDGANARALAADVAMWDQLGCLSPRTCFVEGDLSEAVRFAAEVRDELAALASELPPARTGIGEILDVRRFRDAAAWRGFATGETRLFTVAGGEDAGCVAVDDEPVLRPTPQHRSLRIVPVADAADLEAILAPHRGLVEAVGVATAEARAPVVDAMLRRAGVAHVPRLGDMQRPDLSWRQGDRPRIADWCGETANPPPPDR